MKLLLGDSHIRSYAESTVFNACIFLGPGKELNFASVGSVVSYFFRLYLLKRSIGVDINKSSISFVIGEPDVRFACYRDWWVEGKEIEIKKEDIDNNIRKSIARINFFFSVIKRFLDFDCSVVIGVGTPNVQLIPYAIQFNKLLKKVCEGRGVRFFDPQAMVEKHGVLTDYITSSIMDNATIDNTHLSNKIGLDLCAVFGQIDVNNMVECRIDSNENSLARVKYFERFSSYRVLYNQPLNTLFRILRKL